MPQTGPTLPHVGSFRRHRPTRPTPAGTPATGRCEASAPPSTYKLASSRCCRPATRLFRGSRFCAAHYRMVQEGRTVKPWAGGRMTWSRILAEVAAR